MVQLDVNTRLALTARLGETYAHDERMSDACSASRLLTSTVS